MSPTSTANTVTPDISYRKPKTRQRIHKAPPTLPVPNINEDANERRRVLNVLAQRRYRERKRQEKGRGCAATEYSTSNPRSHARENESGPSVRQDALLSELPVLGDGSSVSINLDLLSTSGSASASLDFVSHVDSQQKCPTTSFEATGIVLFPEMRDSSLSSLPAEASVAEPGAATPNFLDLFSSSSSPSASDNSETTSISFPDSYYLPVNELALLRGLMRIAIRLRCNTTTIWDLKANSPFNDGTHTAIMAQDLPDMWRPTVSQLTIAHHPLIDLLPWPSVRDRIILIMSLPEEARPPAAASPLAIAHLAYDLEDAAEGVRIWGDDPCEPTAWEVGQVFFERWWFIFDRQVTDQSNYWRNLRGAKALVSKHENT